ncbi:TetR family transcriptional regulator [Microbacterium sp. RD1]|uniref:TetR family transcriptional regulator n=1 Tax=Microbacterium sp. RD1 TaxID=3457313 RepID=UPI003FA58AB1
MIERESVRVERTRRAIFGAAEALMLERHEPITVQDVLQRAGVSRGSFYTHFAGLEDLAVEMFRERFSQLGRADLERRESGADRPIRMAYLTVRELVEHVVEHRALYVGVDTLTAGRRAHETLIDLLATQVRATALAIPTRPPSIDVDDLARYIAGGTMALLLHIVRTDDDLDVDRTTARVLALLPVWGAED